MIITVYSRFLSFYYSKTQEIIILVLMREYYRKNKIFFHVLINFLTILNI